MRETIAIAEKTKSRHEILMLDEIRFLADAFRGVGPTIEHCSEYLNQLCVAPELTGDADVWAHTIETASIDDELDRKWDVESDDLLNKIRRLSREARRTIVLGIVEFWERSSDRRAEEVLHWVLEEVNTKLANEQNKSSHAASKPQML